MLREQVEQRQMGYDWKSDGREWNSEHRRGEDGPPCEGRRAGAGGRQCLSPCKPHSHVPHQRQHTVPALMAAQHSAPARRMSPLVWCPWQQRSPRVQEPAGAEVAHVMEELKDRHAILIGKGGLHGNVFRIKPPMCFTRADADFLMDALDDTLAAL